MRVTAEDFAFQTLRLQVRPLHEDDQPLFCRLYCSPSSMRLIGPPMSRDAALASFGRTLQWQRTQPMRSLVLTATDKRSNDAIGLVACPGFDATATRLEIGIMLERTANGKALPREVLIGFVQRLFVMLPVQEIRARYRAANKPIDHIGRSMGFALVAPSPSDADGLCTRVALRHVWMPAFGCVCTDS
ncbi:MAG: GNAT family N-acetyltransferase [Proteobacteria bacterium]|nr:GNAT family N-acetyltransferase [Pseudomonadota bacterium]MBS0465015.1 GNAT family N-acetyltransferase [Pseudomonadota bacterium]